MPTDADFFLVRQPVPDDAAAILTHARAVIGEPGVHFVIGPDEFTYTEEQERAFIRERTEQPNSLLLMATPKTDPGTVIGFLMLTGGSVRARRHVAVLSISVSREYRGRGVGRALMEAGIKWAKENPLVRRLELNVHVENTAARRLYDSIGFVVEGHRSGAIHRDGRDGDDLLMAMYPV